MVDKVRETIRRYAMLDRGMRIGVAVSGGADSVCLLHILCTLAPSEDWSLEVIHFNHSLRGAESDGDAGFVVDLARELGLPCRLEKSDVAATARASGENLEQAAREARRDFYQRVMKSAGLDRIATGHTLSDQAETVLHRILRGSGLQGLSGILPATPEGIVRPLLAVSREEVREWLFARRLPWREDSTNTDVTLTRNRIRHDLIPHLAGAFNPRVEVALSRLADLALEDNRTLDDLARSVLVECGIRQAEGWVIDLRRLMAVPLATRRRLLRLAILDVTGGTRRLEHEHLEALLSLCNSARGNGSITLPFCGVARSFHFLRIGPPPPLWPFPEICLEPPFSAGPISVEPQSYEEFAQLAEHHAEGVDGGCYGLDGNLVRGPLTLRNWRAGDSYQPASCSRVYSLKALFQREKVPSWERRSWPVLLMGEQIVWARRFGVAAWAASISGCSAPLRVIDREPRTACSGRFFAPMNQNPARMRLNK